ncbi:MAG: alkaline phosphatase family protein [Oscillospiraceae bacterium]
MKKLLLLLLSVLFLTSCAEARSVPTVDARTMENGTAELKNGIGITGDAKQLAVYTADGNVYDVSSDDFRLADYDDGNVTGIITDPPEASITDVYDIAKDALDKDEPVLIIYLDGFGWRTYSAVLEKGAIPNIGALSAEMATSMYPTITPVNYAAMVTGQTPAHTGVTDRSGHEVSCDTIFDYASSLGKSSYIVEGDMQIIKFSIDQELHPDYDGDGDTDDEVMETALKIVGEGYDLLFVHLHGIDDTSHAYGPDSAELLEKAKQTDKWVGQLVSAWDGGVIITADHGQHTYDGTGNDEYAGKTGTHGDFRYEDIFIPIITERVD